MELIYKYAVIEDKDSGEHYLVKINEPELIYSPNRVAELYKINGNNLENLLIQNAKRLCNFTTFSSTAPQLGTIEKKLNTKGDK
ncbi:hypothetical protein [Mycoplasma sp. HF14]